MGKTRWHFNTILTLDFLSFIMNINTLIKTIISYTISVFSVILLTPTVFAADSWAEQIKLNGDFRYRYEYIDTEGKDERHRNRLRLRIGMMAKVNDTVDVGAVLATGGDDPVSTNQTLDSQSTTKDIRLDQGYFSWKPLQGLSIKGGKFKNPFYVPMKTELLWDVDLRPEGLVLQYDKGIFTNLGFFYVEERSSADESYLFGGQFGYKATIGNTKFTIGTGYFDYTNIQNHSIDDFDYLADEGSAGNTLAADGSFVTDYNELEVFADMTFHVGDMPVSLFANYVINIAAADAVKDKDTAYLFGFKLGKAKNTGSWDFRYNYREIQADAIFGAFTDSDFIGGGTDGKGHEFNFGFMLDKGWKLGASYFQNTAVLDNNQDFERVQIDLKFKF